MPLFSWSKFIIPYQIFNRQSQHFNPTMWPYNILCYWPADRACNKTIWYHNEKAILSIKCIFCRFVVGTILTSEPFVYAKYTGHFVEYTPCMCVASLNQSVMPEGEIQVYIWDIYRKMLYVLLLCMWLCYIHVIFMWLCYIYVNQLIIIPEGDFYLVYLQLERWWFDFAYLDFRSPLCPFLNFAGPGPYMNHYMPKQVGTGIERAAFIVHYTVQFWHLLRK